MSTVKAFSNDETDTTASICPCHETENDSPVFVPDPYDCKRYFECSNGEPILSFCYDGTVWDPTIDNCNWQWPHGNGVNCTEKLNPDDCCKIEEPIQYSCPPGNSVWNLIANPCDWPYNYNCTDKPNPNPGEEVRYY